MNTGLLEVRPATLADIPLVSRIEQDSFADPWSARSFVETLSSDRMHFLVAEEREELEQSNAEPALLGFVIVLVLTDEAEIADIAVSPVARRRGIGGLLLDSAIVEMGKIGVGTLYLEVRESNIAAQILYRSRGFLPVGRRRGYYRHPDEDALLLKRDFKST